MEIIDSEFGRLVKDDSFSLLNSDSIEWGGNKISFEISIDALSLEEAIKKAKEVWNMIRPNYEKIKNFACNELLEIKNESWSEDEVPLTSEEFISKLKPITIGIYPDEITTVYDIFFDDSDMFLGHQIKVMGEVGKGLLEANI